MKTLIIIVAALVAAPLFAQSPVTDEQLHAALVAAENSPDYKAGFAKGYPMGMQFGSDGGGEPQGTAIALMARNWQAKSAPASSEDWKGGFIAGFWKGFNEKHTAKRN